MGHSCTGRHASLGAGLLACGVDDRPVSGASLLLLTGPAGELQELPNTRPVPSSKRSLAYAVLRVNFEGGCAPDATFSRAPGLRAVGDGQSLTSRYTRAMLARSGT